MATGPKHPGHGHPIMAWPSQARLLGLFVLNPRTGFLFLRVLWTTWFRFFLPQYGPWRAARLRSVAMDLDRHFHFDASWYPTYMSFTRLWMGSLGWLHRRFGRRALPEIAAFLAGVESLFIEAHKVYSVCQSTMSRGPRETRGPEAPHKPVRPPGTPWAIRLLDPNLHCFPSTHVMIVGYNAWALAGILDRLGGPGGDFAVEKRFLLDQARRVVESIIHVKQHSLGDIAPALVLLDSLGHGPGREGMLEFLGGLFPHLPFGQGEAVRAFLKAAYGRLSDRRGTGEQPVPMLVSFLEDYDREIAELVAGL